MNEKGEPSPLATLACSENEKPRFLLRFDKWHTIPAAPVMPVTAYG